MYAPKLIFIEMEKMNGGTLQHLINKISQSNEGNAKSFYLSEEQASNIMSDIFKGLQQIHTKNFIHRDLKPENVLLHIENQKIGSTQKTLYTAKIADFGLSAEYKMNILSG